MDSFVLDATNGLVKFLTLMMDKFLINELGLALLSPPIIELVPFSFVITPSLIIHRSIEMNHVKPSLVHDIFRILSIGIQFFWFNLMRYPR